MEPSRDQIELLQAMEPPDAKVSVVSGTGTGKTAAFGRIAIWHLLCHPYALYEGKLEIGSNTYIGAPRIKQVSDGVWKEMTDTKVAILNGPHAWIADYFTVNTTEVTVNGYEALWFISQVAMQAGKSVGIAGKHRYWQLIILDEAAGISDDHFNVVDGTQTQPGNRTLMASQGVRNAGRFYDSHHELSHLNGGSWHSLRFSSEDSPFVTLKWLQDRLRESGGRNGTEYRVRVLGMFADNSANNLLSRVELEKAFDIGPIIREDEPYGLVLLGDVAMGEYRDDSVLVMAKVIGYGDFDEDARRVEYLAVPYWRNDQNEIQFAGEVVDIFLKANSATLLMDNGGAGATVIKLIEANGVPVTRVDWGKPCFRREYQDRFYNQRACAMVRWRDAVKQGRVRMPQGLTREQKEKILMQGSRLPFKFVEAGGLRYQMEKKEEMRKNGIKSPDVIDAMAFAFLEDAQFIPIGGQVGVVGGSAAAANEVAEADDLVGRLLSNG